MSSILIATVAGLGGMFGWGLADFFAKKTIDQIGDVVSLTWGHIFGTIIIILLLIILILNHSTQISLPKDEVTWLGVAFFGVLQAIVYLLVYRGFSMGQISLLNPVFASFSGGVALISVLFFGELLTWPLLIGLIIIFIGILTLNADPDILKIKRLNFITVPGFKEVAVAALLAICWTLGWDRFILGKDWLTYAVWMYIFMSVALLIYVGFKQINLNVLTPSLWKYVVLIGFCETIAYIAISWGYAATNHTSVVALLSGAFSLPTILLARTFLREKTTTIQTLGSLAIVAGLIVVLIV
jgi:drug/metabolite transporter (DMT)-like permease